MQSMQGYQAIYASATQGYRAIYARIPCNLRKDTVQSTQGYCAIYAVNFIIKLDYQARNGLPPFPDIIYSIHNFILQTFFLFHSLISLSILLFRENYTHLRCNLRCNLRYHHAKYHATRKSIYHSIIRPKSIPS